MNAPPEPAGCLAMLLRLIGIDLAKRRADEGLPYRVRDDFLSAAERSFYGVLRQAIGERAVVLAKVRVADLLYVPRASGSAAHQNRISGKHVDFVLCDPATMRPLAAAELDDSTHERPERRERDTFLNSAFAAAGLPLLRFPAQRQYDVRAIAAELQPLLLIKEPPDRPTGASAPAKPGTPQCPSCGAAMVVKTASRGAKIGQQFYACPNYPRCRTTLPVWMIEWATDRLVTRFQPGQLPLDAGQFRLLPFNRVKRALQTGHPSGQAGALLFQLGAPALELNLTARVHAGRLVCSQHSPAHRDAPAHDRPSCKCC